MQQFGLNAESNKVWTDKQVSQLQEQQRTTREEIQALRTRADNLEHRTEKLEEDATDVRSTLNEYIKSQKSFLEDQRIMFQDSLPTMLGTLLSNMSSANPTLRPNLLQLCGSSPPFMPMPPPSQLSQEPGPSLQPMRMNTSSLFRSIASQGSSGGGDPGPSTQSHRSRRRSSGQNEPYMYDYGAPHYSSGEEKMMRMLIASQDEDSSSSDGRRIPKVVVQEPSQSTISVPSQPERDASRLSPVPGDAAPAANAIPETSTQMDVDEGQTAQGGDIDMHDGIREPGPDLPTDPSPIPPNDRTAPISIDGGTSGMEATSTGDEPMYGDTEASILSSGTQVGAAAPDIGTVAEPVPRPTTANIRQSRSPRQPSVRPPSIITRSRSRSRELSLQPVGRRTRSNSSAGTSTRS